MLIGVTAMPLVEYRGPLLNLFSCPQVTSFFLLNVALAVVDEVTPWLVKCPGLVK